MNLLILIFFTVNVCWNGTCKSITTDRTKVISSLLETSTIKSTENRTQKQFIWGNLVPEQNSTTINELKRIANVKVDPSTRKSKILGSLAYLAGLSASDLTSAKPSNRKVYTKTSPVALNVDASRVSPQIAAIYNPYSYLAHPYILPAPLSVYPLWDPLRLQSFNGIHNNFQTISEQLQSLSSSYNNKPTDLLNNNDEYVDEATKVEKVKASTQTDDMDDGGEFEVEDDRTTDDKMTTSDTACSIQKKINTMANGFKQNPYANIMTRNETVSSNTTIQNSTGNYNFTSYPFYGYYGGYPQNIDHVDITTEPNEYKYHDYEHINYNLPSYDKPINFYSDQRYNYYSVPSGDPYTPNQFHQEQIPEYFSNDFKKYLYTPDNAPSISDHGFRPVI